MVVALFLNCQHSTQSAVNIGGHASVQLQYSLIIGLHDFGTKKATLMVNGGADTEIPAMQEKSFLDAHECFKNWKHLTYINQFLKYDINNICCIMFVTK